jgi:HEAT repeat protein
MIQKSFVLAVAILMSGSSRMSAAPAPDTLPALLKGLEAADASKRIAAADGLEKLGQLAQVAVPDLVRALSDTNQGVRLHAASALLAIDPANQLSSALLVKDMPVLIAMLSDGESDSVIFAAYTLARLGPKSEPAVPALLRVLSQVRMDPNPSGAASLALVRLGPTAVPHLVKTLSDPKSELRERCVMILWDMGPPARAAVPALAKAMNDRDARLQVYAACAITAIDPKNQAAVPVLTSLLKHEDSYIREHAGYGLKNVGPAARVAVPNLVEALRAEKQVGTRIGLAEALAWLDPGNQMAVAALVDALKGTHSDYIRTTALRALGKLGPRAKAVLPAIRAALEDKSAAVRKAAAEALDVIQKNQKPVSPNNVEEGKNQKEKEDILQ